jgi:hypothetical protein
LGFSINLEEARAHKMVRNQDRPRAGLVAKYFAK